MIYMKIIHGIAGSPGIAGAKLLLYQKSENQSDKIGIDEAIEKALNKVEALEKKALEGYGEDNAKIFSAYKMILEDTTLTDPIHQAVEAGAEPEKAVLEVTGALAAVLSSKNNEYMRQRADDITYIGQLLNDMINGNDGEFSFPPGTDKYILAAHELTPVDTMLFDSRRLAGLITEVGGATSHTVILAKSIGIPAVVGADGVTECQSGRQAYIDGYTGSFVYEPDSSTAAEYEKRINDEHELFKALEAVKDTDAHTADGERISVCVNIGNPSDLDSADCKFDGVGLFRSEFLYSSSVKKPSFDEQCSAYRKAIDKVFPQQVTVRTLDIGGDKQLDYLKMKPEENPFLGNRGIRLCLNNPEIFSEQLEALLIAAAGKKVKIMLPMITCIDEISKTRAMLDEITARLKTEGKDCCEDYMLGIMIETPASAIMADVFAKHCDFFSIGTNDLVQYVMAADRGNSDVENIYNPYHPSVLRMINRVIKAGADESIEVSVCGDLAANTSFTALLLGMGLKKFSVPIPMTARIKHKIQSVKLSEAKILAEKVLSCSDEHEIKNILKED